MVGKCSRKLTQELIERLAACPDKKTLLTEFYEQKYKIRPYLLSLLETSLKPTEVGFRFTIFSNDRLWIYELANNEIICFQELKDGRFKNWPGPTD